MTPKTLRLAARCPVCCAQPALRVREQELELYRDRHPDDVIMNVQCHRCLRSHRITHYDITARAYQGAA